MQLCGWKGYSVVVNAVSLLLFFALSSIAQAQDLSKPEELPKLLEEWRAEFQLPALAAAVVRDGKILTLAAVGERKWKSGVPVTTDDVFHLGSCTKAMTATMIAKLVEQGTLRWDTTIAEGLPMLAEEMAPAYRDVTLDQLLAHRAGLPNQSWPPGETNESMMNLPGSQREQRLEYIRMILAIPPDLEPGAAYRYANVGYSVAGAIAEHVTDTSWDDLMQQWLFGPLGMSSAGVGAAGDPEKIDQPWPHRFGLRHKTPIPPGPRGDNPPVIAPGGMVHCNIADWAKFVILHLTGEAQGKPYLSEALRQKLHTSLGDDYALGWAVLERDWAGGTALTHAGSNTMNFALTWLSPSKRYAVLVVTNQDDRQNKTRGFCDTVCARLINRYPPPASAAE